MWVPCKLKCKTNDVPHLACLALLGIPLPWYTILEELVVGCASGLRVRCTPRWCGKTCRGPGGETVRRQVDKEHREANEQVAPDGFEASLNLNILEREIVSGRNRRRIRRVGESPSAKDAVVLYCTALREG